MLTAGQRGTFGRDGYVVFDAGVAEAVVDGAVGDLARLPGDAGVRFREARLQDGWRLSRNILDIATAPTIVEAVRDLYGAEPRPFQTLNFPRGSQQRPHADSIHFNSEPFGRMCGVWFALEDIGPDQGPLVYYPGSQRLPEFNFDDLGIASISYDNYGAYELAIAAKIAEHGLAPSFGLMKKGQALIWSANLLHGGAPQNDLSRTRLSQVTHYYFPGCRYWRPGASRRVRAYFEPAWIPRDRDPVGSAMRRIYYRGRNLINKL